MPWCRNSIALLAMAGASVAAAGADVRIVAGFDYSPNKRVERVSENHFVVHIGRGFCNWFLFRIEGAEGRTITIDLKDAPIRKWKTLNPVYSYVKDIHALDAFAVDRRRVPGEPRRAANGPLIPDTSGQAWQFIGEVSVEGQNLRLRQAFEEDRVWLAMKYPYTCEYSKSFVDRLAKLRRSYVEVVEIAQSKEGRPIRLVKIGRGGEDRKPCVLIYAREHPTEHDTSWVAEGAILFLLSNAPEARAIRGRFTFLVIPLLDPDGAVKSKYRSLGDNFTPDSDFPEPLQIAEWFKKWVDDGKRLDLVIDLHNVESNEGPHVFNPASEKAPAPGRPDQCRSFHETLVGALRGFSVRKGLGKKPSWGNSRLMGFTQCYYDALALAYEVNSQAPGRHLTIDELHRVGGGFVRASADYLSSSAGGKLLARTTRWRRARALWRERFDERLKGREPWTAEEFYYAFAEDEGLVPEEFRDCKEAVVVKGAEQ